MASELTNPTWMRSGKNGTGSTILAKRFLAPDAALVGQIRLPAAVTTVGEGVTTEDIPDGYTGSYQRDGIAIVTCSAAVSAGAFVQSGTDGRAATAATASAIRGIAKSTTANAGEDLEVELWNGRFIAP
jgi:hypothetical protein